MPTTKQGDYGSVGGTQAVPSDFLVKGVLADRLFYEEAEISMLTLLARAANKEKVPSFKFEWFEQQERPHTGQVNNGAGYAAGDVSIVVDDADPVQVNSLIAFQRIQEVCYVSAVNVTTNTLTIERSWGGTAAAALLDNDYFTIVGAVAMEGANAELGLFTEPTNPYNHTQIYRNPYSVTRTEEQSATYAGVSLKDRRFQAARNHKIDIEMSGFVGERNQDTSGNGSRHSTGGLWEFATSNLKAFGGVNPTYAEIVAQSDKDFRYGSKKKMLFCGRGAAGALSMIPEDKIRTVPKADSFGTRLNVLFTQHGDYVIHSHPLLSGGELASMCFVVDIRNFGYGYLQDVILKPIVDWKKPGSSGADAVKEEWLSEMGWIRKLERTHSIWTGAAA